MSRPTRSWKDVLADQPVNKKRAEIYEHLMEAQEQIAHALLRRGVRDELVQAALDAADQRLTAAERREDLYFSLLVHYVEALGGQVEVRALFGDEAVVVRHEPADQRARQALDAG